MLDVGNPSVAPLPVTPTGGIGHATSESSLVMVPTMVEFVGPERMRVKVSSGSTTVWPLTATVTVFVVRPGWAPSRSWADDPRVASPHQPSQNG